MLKKLLVLGCITILCMNMVFAEKAVKSYPPADEAGYALLESLVVAFSDMARTGKGGFEDVNPILQRQMAMLKKARSQNQVEALFYNRYHRILEVLKLTIRKKETDPEGILDNFTHQEIKKFIMDVTGADATIPPPENRGIGAIAGIIAEEIINLHLYLDSRLEKENVMKKYTEWTKPPKK